MQQDTVIPFPHPQLTAEDPLTEVLRRGAQRLLAQAIEAEVAMLLAPYADRRDSQGRQRLSGVENYTCLCGLHMSTIRARPPRSAAFLYD
jgi:hypothetical protein